MATTRNVIAPGLLALVAWTGCLARPPGASEGDPAMTERTARPGRGDQAARLAERARLSASGRFAAPQRAAARTAGAAVALADEPDWAGALDIPGGALEAGLTEGSAEAATVRNALGVIKPIRGDDFVLLSTGHTDYGQPGSLTPEPGTDYFPPGNPGGDQVVLRVKVRVPDGANQLSLQYNFLSTEAPDFNTGPDNPFNDTFTIELEDAVLGLRSFELASVNSSTFFLVSDSRARDTGFDLFTGDTDGVDGSFPGGFPDAGLTDFRAFGAEVTAGSELTLRFIIKDIGDGLLDSAVLIDAVQFTSLQAMDPNAPTPGDNLITAEGNLVQNVDALAAGGVPIRGVVADGATEVLLRVKVPAQGDVDFAVVDDRPDPEDARHGRVGTLVPVAGGAPVAALSTPTVTTTGQQFYALAVYRAPATFNRGDEGELTERTVELIAKYRPTAGTGFDTKVSLQIRRPPVVLVRGLWSQPSDWHPDPTDPDSQDNPAFIVNNPTFAISEADYAYACDPPAQVFPPPGQLPRPGPGQPPLNVCDGQPHNELRVPCEADPGTIRDAARNALDNLRHNGIAATKVDVIAHGTGGIRVRQYIESDAYTNPRNLNLGDVNRLITVNTPHFGAEIGAKVAQGRDASATEALKANFECVSRRSFNPIEPGDIDDMARTEFSLQATPVPAHAIVGTGGTLLHDEEEEDWKETILPKLITGGPVISKAAVLLGMGETLYNDSFGACDHDLFADVVSQRGGLSGQAVTEIAMTDEPKDPDDPVCEDDPLDPICGISRDDPDTDQFRALRHPDVNAKIKLLLNTAVGSPEFSEFPATTEAQHCDPATVGAAQAGARLQAPLLATGTLRIISPSPGATVIAGDRLVVSVVGEGGFVPRTVFVFTSRGVRRNNTPPFNTTITVPGDALGPTPLLAIGLDAQGQIAVSEDVLVDAATTATLTAVRIITQDPILYGASLRRHLFVVGQYDDGVVRDITTTGGTEYLTSDPDIVTASSDGTITAVGPGIATVVARNGLRQDSITVTVKQNLQPKARAGADVSLVCVAPGDTVPVQFDGSDSSDVEGDPLSFAWFEGGVQIATGATPIVGLAAGVHTLELVVSDGISGPAHDTVVVSVTPDVEPPVLQVAGENPRTTECGLAYSDDGATASDACDGDLTAAVRSQVHVDTGVVGEYTVDYQVQDGVGLTATASRAVTVADRKPPALVVLGPNPATTECGFVYKDDGAAASDLCDGDLSGAVQSASHVDPANPGSYAVDYQVHDRVGLTAAASRAVTVADRTSPALLVLGPNPASTECGLTYRDEGAAASDTCDGDLTAAVQSVSHVDPTNPGSYTVDYQVHDRAGLSASASRSVSVADHTPPRITLLGDNPKTVECGVRYRDSGATASDLCDGDLSGSLFRFSHVNTRVPGTYSVDFRVRDHSGLAASERRRVIVTDTTAPRVTVEPMRTLLPPDERYRSFELSDCAAAYDACSGRLDIDRLGDIVAIHSDEPDRTSRNDPDDDIVISSHSRFKLRQQALRHGNGRVYEIEFTVRDDHGNRGETLSCFIGVNALFHHGAPVNDGRVFTVRPRR